MHASRMYNISMQSLRKAIAEKVYPNMGIRGNEVFVSDGAQCDIARFQVQQSHELASISYGRSQLKSHLGFCFCRCCSGET